MLLLTEAQRVGDEKQLLALAEQVHCKEIMVVVSKR